MFRWFNEYGRRKRIYELVKQDINTATNNLVNEANSAGGYDNITVIIIN